MKAIVPEKSRREWEKFFKRCDADRKSFDKLQRKINESFERKPNDDNTSDQAVTAPEPKAHLTATKKGNRRVRG